MVSYLLARVAGIVFVLLAVSFLTFALMYSVPGGAFDHNQQPLSAAALANIRRKYGLDQPFYVHWSRDVISAAQGDFGTSYHAQGEPIINLSGKSWGVSLHLGLLT